MPGDLRSVLDLTGPRRRERAARADGAPASLAAGVGVGDLVAVHVGSPQRWEYVVWGEPLSEMVRSVQQHARPGDALASQDVLALAPDALRMSTDALVTLPNSLLLLKAVAADAAGVDAPAAHAAADEAARALVGETKMEVKAARAEAMPYVAGSERVVIQRGGVEQARSHIAALECTVMVIRIVADVADASSVLRTQQAVQIIQRVLYKHEAAFKHYAQMGHGGLCVTGFGLPPFVLKPAACARRAVAAGCMVRAKLEKIGVGCTIGISAGPVCIGCLPSAERIEYALLGRPVALAILMANACSATRPLLLDDICFQASKTTYNFEAIRAVLHGGGGATDSLSSYRMLMLFSLVSTKPIEQARREGAASHVVLKWLRSRGAAVHEESHAQLAAVAVRELRECFDGLDTRGEGFISLPQLRAALRETSIFGDDLFQRDLFQRMSTDGSGRVSWPEFLHAMQSFTAGSAADGATAEEQAGSGTLGENIRLLLLAYGHRRHLQRSLGDAFTARYHTGPLGEERYLASGRASSAAQQDVLARRKSVSARRASIRRMSVSGMDMREAGRIAEEATDFGRESPNRDASPSGGGGGARGSSSFSKQSPPPQQQQHPQQRRKSLTPGGGRRVSLAVGKGPAPARVAALQSSPLRRASSRMQRRESLARALERSSISAPPGAVTTDEMIFGRRGSSRSNAGSQSRAALAELGGGASDASSRDGGGGNGGGNESFRDWTGLPRDVAHAILAEVVDGGGNGGRGAEAQPAHEGSLLSVMEDTDRNFAAYLATRPADWAVRRERLLNERYVSTSSRECRRDTQSS